MQPVKIIVLLILIGLVAIFTFQNTQVAEVTLYFWEFSLSVSLLLLATLATGLVLGMTLMFVHTMMRARRRDAASTENISSNRKDSLWDS